MWGVVTPLVSSGRFELTLFFFSCESIGAGSIGFISVSISSADKLVPDFHLASMNPSKPAPMSYYVVVDVAKVCRQSLNIISPLQQAGHVARSIVSSTVTQSLTDTAPPSTDHFFFYQTVYVQTGKT